MGIFLPEPVSQSFMLNQTTYPKPNINQKNHTCDYSLRPSHDPAMRATHPPSPFRTSRFRPFSAGLKSTLDTIMLNMTKVFSFSSKSLIKNFKFDD
jgi:hypothetical protein